MSLAPKRAVLRAPLVVLALATGALAQEPATPPPATSGKTDGGAAAHELLPDLGGFLTVPLARVPLAGPPGAPFPVRRAVPTELHLRQVSPFALRYTIRSLDHVRLRPYFGAGLDMVVVIAEERGGRSPEARSDYEFGPLGSSDRLLRQAAEIERAAQEAYTALVSQIRPRDYMLSAAFMLVDEVRHLTVWRRVLGLQIY